MKLYITRHGKTQWNIESRFQGWLDSPLTSSGKEDAVALSNYMKNIQVDFIYSSPLNRALETANLIFPFREILIDQRLKEMNFGVFEGMKTDDILLEYEELYDQLWNHPELFTRIPNGESYEEVASRAQSFLMDCFNKHKNESVMIVVHGMYFIVLLGLLRGYTKSDYPKINRHITRGCSLTCIEIDNNKIIEHYIGLDTYLKKEDKDTYLIKK